PESRHTGDFKVDILVHDPLFTVECWESGSPAQTVFKTGDLQILCALTGTATVKTDSSFLALSAGQFCLLPASLPSTTIEFCAASRILVATPGPQT
ncbi:MAG TPA: hypothetical protein VLT36_15145, partial [Candidatus Dormibacteraeota bacterium]|nr:hypothetical protein [Candidatus Dormibacteraeota bacterium]